MLFNGNGSSRIVLGACLPEDLFHRQYDQKGFPYHYLEISNIFVNKSSPTFFTNLWQLLLVSISKNHNLVKIGSKNRFIRYEQIRAFGKKGFH
jgi:hypothetical protein